VVVDDLDVERIRAAPDEADSPLIVDSNAVLSSSSALQFLKSVRWRNTQRIQAASRGENFKLSRSQALNISRQPSRKPTTENSLGFPTLEGFDHGTKY
jgi:hypothetical protein